jgi:hypothetical protein
MKKMALRRGSIAHGATQAGLLSLLSVLLALSPQGNDQPRSESGPYKGFLIARPETVMVEIPKPFKVSVVQGQLTYPTAQDQEPVPGAFFEIRDSAGRVRTATTDDKGMFTIAGVPPGRYDFKTTQDEFKSYVGTVAVGKHFSRQNTIRLSLEVAN